MLVWAATRRCSVAVRSKAEALGAWVPLPDHPYPQDDRSWDDVWKEENDEDDA